MQENTKPVAFEIMAPVVAQGFWFKFLSIFNLVFQGIHALMSLLSCWGIMVMWVYVLPMWSSISALGAVGDLQRAEQRQELLDIESGARKLALSIKLLGITTLLGLCLMLFVLGALSVMVLVFGVDLSQEVEKWSQMKP